MTKLKFPLFSEEEYDSGVDTGHIANVSQAFLSLNEQRLQLAFAVARLRQQEFLHALPILLHYNHPLLPGWAGTVSPCGIASYQPNDEQIHYAKRLAKSLVLEEKQNKDCDILGVYLIGSTGSIAQNENSDLDIWVVHRPEVSTVKLKVLQEKINKIQDWGNKMGCDVHCFLMAPNYFQEHKGKIEHADNCGSAQHFLLLDEFYRTGLLVAGLYPLWWLVPPDQENNYEAYAQRLLEQRFIRSDQCIDFGGVPKIPAEEFLGAALWQLHKAIESPYKSVLKILLMEYYASSYPNSKPLCFDLKSQVYADEKDPARLDPYLMIYYCTENYLSKINAWQRLELVRRCLYVKIGTSLAFPQREKKWQVELMNKVTADWDWPKQKFKYLDQVKDWKAVDVMRERQALMNELNYCYQFLSKFAAINQAIAHISYEDLTLLGRKLFASFERKPGKIESINPGITADLVERKISFQYNETQLSSHYWSMHVFDEYDNDVFLKKSAHLSELVTWTVVNGLYSQQTQLQVVPGSSLVQLKQVDDLLHFISAVYDQRPAINPVDSFINLAELSTCVFVVNMGFEPSLNWQDEKFQVISDRSDPLSYGKEQKNLVASIDLITFNTWNEVYVTHFDRDHSLLSALATCLNQLGSTRKNSLAYHVWCAYSNHSDAIKRRAGELINDVLWYYYDKNFVGIGRYVVSSGDEFAVLEQSQDLASLATFDSESALLDHLGFPLSDYAPIAIDSHCQVDDIIGFVIRKHIPDKVQFFYYCVAEKLYIYILDESGCLYRCTEQGDSKRSTVLHYLHFLERLAFKKAASEQTIEQQAIQLKEIHWDQSRQKWSLQGHNDLTGVIPEKAYFVQAIGYWRDDGNMIYDFFCEGIEFSYNEYGEKVFQAVQDYVLDKRCQTPEKDKKLTYPIYLSDLDIQSNQVNTWHTSLYLHYKSVIETQLNQSEARS